MGMTGLRSLDRIRFVRSNNSGVQNQEFHSIEFFPKEQAFESIRRADFVSPPEPSPLQLALGVFLPGNLGTAGIP
jgi:hypothetical protein